MTPEEILKSFYSAVTKELDKQAAALEERRMWYEKTASKLTRTPTKVQFVIPDDILGRPNNGTVEWVDGRYLIKIRPGLSLNEERSCFCHEVGHAVMGHVKNVTPADRETGEALRAVLLSGRLDKAAGFDTRQIYLDAYAKGEREADEIGLRLYGLFWPE